MKPPAIADLRAAIAVAQHRSFRAAASELGLSPSALSHLVATLEERLGLRLFHRTTRSVSVTPAGQRFLDRVRPALEELAEAIAGAHEADGEPSGTLRINASRGGARQVLLPLVAEYLALQPRVAVEISTAERLVDLVAEGCDLGLRYADLVPKDMIAVPCSTGVAFAVVGSPAYFAKHPRPSTPAELRAHDCIRMRSAHHTTYPWEFERHGEEVTVEVTGSLVVDDDDLKVRAAKLGCGLAYASEWAVAADVEAGALIRVLREWTPPHGGLCLYYPGHRLVPPTVRAFVEMVRARSKRPRRAKGLKAG